MTEFSCREASSGPGIKKAVDRDPPNIEAGEPANVASRLEDRGLLGMVDGVCALRGVTRSDVCGRSRTKAVREARAEVWFLMRTWPDRSYSLPEIGAIFDRDHATIYSAIKGHVERIVGKP